MTLEEHILDQMRRYQNVTLSFAQADMVLGLLARAAPDLTLLNRRDLEAVRAEEKSATPGPEVTSQNGNTP